MTDVWRKTKKKTRITVSLSGTATLPRPACRQRGDSTRERGAAVRLAPGGDTGQWPERVLNPATASKGRQVPVPSCNTVPPPTPLPAREPGRAQDTRDPGLALPWRQEQPAHTGTRLEGDSETPGVPSSVPPKSKRRRVIHCRDPNAAQQTDSEPKTQAARPG